MIWKKYRVLRWVLGLVVLVMVVIVEGRKKKGDTIILYHGKKCIPTIIKSGGRVKGDFVLIPSHQQKECQREMQKEEEDEMKAEESKTSHSTFVPTYWNFPIVPIIQRRIVYHIIQPTYQPYHHQSFYQPMTYYSYYHPLSGRDYFGPGQYQYDPSLYSYSSTLNRQMGAY